MLLASQPACRLQKEQQSSRAVPSVRQPQLGQSRAGSGSLVRAHTAPAPDTSTSVADSDSSRPKPGGSRGKLHALLHALESVYTPLNSAPTSPAAAAPPAQRQQQQQQQRQPVRLVQLGGLPATKRKDGNKDKPKLLKQEQKQKRPVQQQRQQVDLSKGPKRSAAGGDPAGSLSDASLTRSITCAATSLELVALFKREQQRMNYIHTSAMMKRLASLVSSTASHRQVMSSDEGKLWIRLRDKALLTVSSAQLRQVVDVLAAVHSIASSREQHHLGWVRAVPEGAAASGEASVAAAADPKARRRRQQQETLVQGAGAGHAAALLEADDETAADDSNQLAVTGHFESSVPELEAAAEASPQPAWRSRPSEEAHSAQPHPAAPAHEEDDPGVFELDSSERRTRSYPRPLHSSRVLLQYEKDLVQALLQHSSSLVTAAADPPSLHELLDLVSVVGRLGFAAGPAWQAAFFGAMVPHLPRLDRGELTALSGAVTRLQPARLPPPAWLIGFYRRSQALMHTLEAHELSSLITCAARLPPPHPEGWVDSVVQRCTDCMDRLDAPAFALVLHSLGRMRQRSLKPWVQELLESSTNLLYDFSPEELSLVLRGCAMLRVSPDSEWFIEFFTLSQGLMRRCSGPQLVNIGWALAVMRCMPPRQWIHEWMAQLRNRLHAGGRPLGVSSEKWHGVGYAAHAKRAVVAIAAFRGAELEDWCKWLRTPLPRQKAPPPLPDPPAATLTP